MPLSSFISFYQFQKHRIDFHRIEVWRLKLKEGDIKGQEEEIYRDYENLKQGHDNKGCSCPVQVDEKDTI